MNLYNITKEKTKKKLIYKTLLNILNKKGEIKLKIN